MKRSQPIIDNSLNDSDDSLLFKNPVLKRKPAKKTSSPGRKRAKINNSQLYFKKSESLKESDGSSLNKDIESINQTLGASTSEESQSTNLVGKLDGELTTNFIEDTDVADSIGNIPAAHIENTTKESPSTVSSLSSSSELSELGIVTSECRPSSSKATSSDASPLSNISQSIPGPKSQKNKSISPVKVLPKKTGKKSSELLLCPLCPKTFESKSGHLSHMKQCAKKKHLSVAQLMVAIEWKKNNPDSTYACEKLVTAQNKAVNRDQATDELSVAIAMSLSDSHASSSSYKPITIDKSVVDSQLATLEKFGFTTTASAQPVGVRRGKTDLKKIRTVLRSRTAEDRLKLLTEKAAVILLSDNMELPPEKPESSRLQPQDEQLQFQAPMPRLWDLGNSDDGGPWYLTAMKDDLEQNTVTCSSRSSIDSTSTVEANLTEDNLVDGYIGIPSTCDLVYPQCDNLINSCVHNPNDPAKEDLCFLLAKVNLPKNTICDDWEKMVNNKLGSDLAVKTIDGNLYLHSLVLHTRCPGFFEVDYHEAFRDKTSSSALVFLNYVYSGNIGVFHRGDLIHVAKLAEFFKCTSLVSITTALKSLANGSGSSDDTTIPCTPKGNEPSSAIAATVKMVADRSVPSKLSPTPADEADTVPVIASCMDFVDLTSNPSPASCENDNEAQNEGLLWKHEETDKHQEHDEEVMESIERVQEMEKIASFLQSQTERNQSIADVLEKEELEESQTEREKIYRLSRHSEQDLFEEVDDIEEVPAKSLHDEVIVVSSDEDNNDFEVSTDEDNTELLAKAENVTLAPFNLPHDPQEFDDFLEYFPSEGVIAMSPLQSQSLVKSVISPRTPKHVLGKQSTPTNSPVRSSTPFNANPEENVRKECPTSIPTTADEQTGEVTPYLLSASARLGHSAETPLGETTKAASVVRRRKSVTQRVGQKIIKRTRKSLLMRRSYTRTSLLKSQPEAIVTKAGEALSSSLIEGLNETWAGSAAETSECERPFVEITPRQTPSVKLSDKVTPQPNFSAMKTGSIKKHLEKYGLKRSLGKTKAKKILNHIYNELHPVVNTKTGKFVRYLDGDDKKKKQRVKLTKRKSTAKTNTGKNKVRDRLPEKSNNAEPISSSHLPNLQKSVPKSPLTTTSNTVTGVTSTSPIKSSGVETTVHNSTFDNSNSFSSDVVYDSESEDSEEEFAELEDEILTQTECTRMNVEGAVTKYINENSSLRRQVLIYHPIWVDELRRNIQATYGAKYKLIEIMDFLDKKCITFRSEAQAANNMKRNEKKKQSPKKKKKKE